MTGYIEESVTRIETACTDCDTDSMNNQSTGTQPSTSTQADKSNQSQVKPEDSFNQSELSDTGHTLGGATGKTPAQDGSHQPDVDAVRQRRIAFLDKLKTTAESGDGNNETGNSLKDSTENTAGANTTSELNQSANTQISGAGMFKLKE